MTGPPGPLAGDEDASPFPAGYGPVGVPGDLDPSLRRSSSAPPLLFDQTSAPLPPAPAVAPPPAATPPRHTRRAAGAGRPPASRRPPPPRPVRRPARRRLVRQVDTWTVFRVSLVFYLVASGIVLLAGIVAWNVASALGFVDDIQRAVRSLADDRRFVIHPLALLEYSAMVLAVLAIAGAVLNVVAALLYNLISDVVGGVEVVVVGDEE